MVYSLAGICTCFLRQLAVFSGYRCRYGGAWLGNNEEELLRRSVRLCRAICAWQWLDLKLLSLPSLVLPGKGSAIMPCSDVDMSLLDRISKLPLLLTFKNLSLILNNFAVV